jgi:acetyl-CoA carboxylase carboxyl transferase subunit alpha
MNYIEFEKPIEELYEQLEKIKQVGEKSKVDTRVTVKEINDKIVKERERIARELTPWQRVQLSRHPDRPYCLDYIEAITGGNFFELHGDRGVNDDKAMIGGIGKIEGKSILFVGQQKGNTTKQRQYRNFGMPNPEGYRKALRLMKLAEKFDIPIVTLIDTPGAYPGIEAEERGQAEAIARNIYEMMRLRVPVIAIIIGEGASGGALGIGIGDKVLMLENTWYSVISPESCSTILWRSRDFKEKAADALKLIPSDMLSNGMIDGIIKEPLGGAHVEPKVIFETVKDEIVKNLEILEKMYPDERIDVRIKKFCNMGVFTELAEELQNEKSS